MPPSPAGTPTGTATILFTDLVGSTTLRAQLGEERAEAARQAHHRLLGATIATHRGTVHDDLGDGIMASFAGAADAVAAAVAIQQAITAGSQRGAEPAAVIRVGISAGDVAWEDTHPHGMPLVEAARLCAAAEGGQILVADIVRVLARGRGGHTFTSVGALALKGLPEPLEASAVAWEPLAVGGFPLPPRLTTKAAVAMFGRAAESAALAAAWAKAKGGQRQLVLIAGEPGIGKTRLAAETALAAHADGGAVLLGGCDEDVKLPYQPFVEALRHYVAHAPDAVLSAHVCEHKGELVRLAPELARRVADLPAPQVAEAETERYLLFEAATGLLSEASQQQPIVLILDDLHWAGTPELLLLKHILKTTMPLRLLIVGTYRDTDLTRTHPLTAALADFRRETGVERIALHGLDEAAVVGLVTAAAGHELTAPGIALARTLHQETEGSPFFIGEILRHLSESGAIFQEGDRWTFKGDIAGLGIPEGIKEVIGRRLSRLSDDANKVLGLAAVIGRRFDVGLLARIADASEDAVLDTLDEATAAALVAEVPDTADGFAFSHALIRTTLYEELSAARRARLHRRIGEALEDLTAGSPDARIDELAHHWLAATQVTDRAKAIAYARRAGDRALANLAFEEAADHYERALAVLEPRDQDGERLRCDLLLAVADAQRRGGNADYRAVVTRAVEAARALGDGERLARATLTSARPGGWMASANVLDEGLIALYEVAIAALGSADGVLRARLLGQLAVELIYTPDRERRDALTAEAIAITRRLGDRMGLAQVLILRLMAMSDPFTLAERLTVTAELAALAEEVGSREVAWHAALHRAGALLESGDVAGGEAALAEAERLAGELRQPLYSWFAQVGRTMLAVMRGAPDAEERMFATFELGTAGGQSDAPAALGAQLVEIRQQQGRIGELADAVRANIDAMPHMPVWRAALAWIYTETDRLTEAREIVDDLRSTGFEDRFTWAWDGYVVALSMAAAALGDRATAATLYDRLRPLAEQVRVTAVVASCSGSYSRHCGLLASCLGRYEDAERHFAHAVAMNERLGARSYVVRTRRAWASMLLDRNAPGDAARARDLIAAGRAEAETLGMARELVRFDRLAARIASS